MTIREELDQADQGLRVLQSAARGLRARLGTDLDVLRLIDDISRCGEDIARLRVQSRAPREASDEDVIVVPEGDYDTALWSGADVDAEGLGVPGRRAP
jgi:hypothetical protein